MIYQTIVLALVAASCASESSIDRGATACPPGSGPCAVGCARIEARGVKLAAIDAVCKSQPQTLGCYARPATELLQDACVISTEGEAFGVLLSEQEHLLGNGYRACSKVEFETWEQAKHCDG